MIIPIKQNINIDLKQIKKHLEDCINTVEEHQDKLLDIDKWYKRIDATIYRQLKNNDIENELLGREINRMHEIERIKV